MALVFLCLMQGTGVAARFFVSSSSGEDRRSSIQARSASTPWRTIQRGLNTAGPGDTLVLLPGVYSEHARFERSGELDRPIKLEAREHGKARIIGSIGGIGVAHIHVSGLDVANSRIDPDYPMSAFDPKGIYFYYSHHVTISTNRVHDCRGGGIGLVNADEVLVCDNVVSNNAADFDGSHSGISVYQPVNYLGQGHAGPGIKICRNLCFNNRNSQFYSPDGQPREITDGHGIIVDDTPATQRENFEADLEYFWSVAPHAPSMPLDWQSPYSRTILIENNLCHSNGGSGISLFICENVIVRNNTCALNQRNLFDIAEINLGDSLRVQVQNNLMVSPMRTQPVGGQASSQVLDQRQAAKLTTTFTAEVPASIMWTSNALYDSPTLAAGLEPMHDNRSLALRAPSQLAVNLVTGAVSLNISGQTRDRGSPYALTGLGDARLAPRVQGRAIDIGAIEESGTTPIFGSPAEELAYYEQLELQSQRAKQLPFLNFK